MIIGLPIPFLFFWEMPDGKLEIVDGSQRLRSIEEFVLGDLRLGELEGLTLLSRFKYSELPGLVMALGWAGASVCMTVCLGRPAAKAKRRGPAPGAPAFGSTRASAWSASGVLALYSVADTIKPSSREGVAALMALGITPVMLTGDNQATATAIAFEGGISAAEKGRQSVVRTS